MIVGARPRFRQIIIEVWTPLTILFVWDVAVTAFHMMTPIKEPPLPTALFGTAIALRSEEHTSELQSLMRISYAVFCLEKNKTNIQQRDERFANRQYGKNTT